MIPKHTYQGVVIRAAKPVFAHQPTSGEGAAKRGGRFNPIGTPALYTSLKVETVVKEVRFALNTISYLFYHLGIACDDIADLTNPAERKALNISYADLSNANWESDMLKGILPSTHKVYYQLRQEQNYAGILVNSFAPEATPDDVNLVLWTWMEVDKLPSKEPHAVTVLDQDGLPKDAQSWT